MADNSSQGSESQSAKDRGSVKRSNLNSAIAQRQKLLLGGIGAVALIAGSMFIFGGDDAQDGEDGGATTIDTGGLVNRNLSQREFVATYGNRLDAQGKAIKDLQDSQLPKSAIEQELETLRGENARMLSDGQAAIDAISAENAALRSELETVRANPPVAPVTPADPRQGGTSPSPLDPTTLGEPKASLLSFDGEKAKATPVRSSDGSESQRPLAIANWNTCPIHCFARRLMSSAPRSSIFRMTFSTSGGVISCIMSSPKSGNTSWSMRDQTRFACAGSRLLALF